MPSNVADKKCSKLNFMQIIIDAEYESTEWHD